MSSPAFTLSVPADERLRGLATDVVRTWFTLTGRASPEADTFISSVTAAINRLATDLADIEVVVEETASGVEVRLSSEGRHETLHAPVQHPDTL